MPKTKIKKNILYECNKRAHLRVFEAFSVMPDIQQAVISPSFVVGDSLQIGRVHYNYPEENKELIKKIDPDIYVQCDFGDKWHTKLDKYGIKKAFIAHGLWDYGSITSNMASKPVWNNYDILFGCLPSFKELLVNKAGINPKKIVLGDLPQFDLLYSRITTLNNIKSKIIVSSKLQNASKVITLFGHKVGRSDFGDCTRDYYISAVKLSELAKQNNWLLAIKPKTENSFKFINNAAAKGIVWAKEYAKRYNDLVNNNNVQFISPYYESYDYFCTDAIICVGSSTIELEASLANRPLILVRTGNSVMSDNYPFKSVENGCAYLVDNFNNLNATVLLSVNSSNAEQIIKQKKYVSDFGLKLDGLAHRRVLDALLKL